MKAERNIAYWSYTGVRLDTSKLTAKQRGKLITKADAVMEACLANLVSAFPAADMIESTGVQFSKGEKQSITFWSGR